MNPHTFLQPTRPARTVCPARLTRLAALCLVFALAQAFPQWAWGGSKLPGTELRQRLDVSAPAHAQDLALTLDACGRGFDAQLISLLVSLKIPATVFVTQRWLRRHPEGLRELQAHPELFELENHGAAHMPAVVGQSLYGMKGPDDISGVEREIAGGAEAVQAATGRAAQWYRGAGARYDSESLSLIQKLGLGVAGYSLNADDGGTAAARTVEKRLLKAKPGDIILAHVNRPASGTAEGLARALPLLQQQGMRFVKLSQAAAVISPTPAVKKSKATKP